MRLCPAYPITHPVFGFLSNLPSVASGTVKRRIIPPCKSDRRGLLGVLFPERKYVERYVECRIQWPLGIKKKVSKRSTLVQVRTMHGYVPA